MKKVISLLIVSLVVVGGLVFANRKSSHETALPATPKPLSAADRKTEREQWEASPDGIKFKAWEASPAGKKVYAAEARIRKHLDAFSGMEAVVTSLTLPPGSRLGFGVMARIEGEEYIVSFGPEVNDEFQALHSLKAGDKIILKSHNVSHAPKYAYPIVAGEWVERDGKVLYKREQKEGC